ncbi:hypothetical protein C8F04DRAFT_1318414 [Mycena alexandri]|uniref:Uncharacterized protein n=1 Tax=Mycena alexandri TaxID=1745969 RepID=A0AAD6WPF1_9AGAR|nr:hypothetical protein C8F04DRAFT_1318414 [Mycena alexandri]
MYGTQGVVWLISSSPALSSDNYVYSRSSTFLDDDALANLSLERTAPGTITGENTATYGVLCCPILRLETKLADVFRPELRSVWGWYAEWKGARRRELEGIKTPRHRGQQPNTPESQPVSITGKRGGDKKVISSAGRDSTACLRMRKKTKTPGLGKMRPERVEVQPHPAHTIAREERGVFRLRQRTYWKKTPTGKSLEGVQICDICCVSNNDIQRQEPPLTVRIKIVVLAARELETPPAVYGPKALLL